MEGTLLVAPQQLKNTANSFSNRANTIRSLTQEMMTKVRGMSAVFEGEAGNTYINQFSKLQEDMNKIQNKIKEHVEDLYEMSTNFETTETQNIQENAALQSNYI